MSRATCGRSGEPQSALQGVTVEKRDSRGRQKAQRRAVATERFGAPGGRELPVEVCVSQVHTDL